MMIRTIALIPIYNEERLIGDLIKRTLNYVDKVIVCDDGSVDRSRINAEKAGAYVIGHDKNRGKGAALKTLFDFAKNLDFDAAITMDGDGQFLPEEIPKLANKVKEGSYDIVIGNRSNIRDMPYYRKIGNRVLDKMTNLVSELGCSDTQSGFRAYSKRAIENVVFTTTGFGADSEILIDATKKGLKITEEKVTVIYDTGGRTSTKNPLSHSGEVISSLIELATTSRPLRYVGLPGLIFIGISFYFGILTINYFDTSRYFSVPLSLITLGFFITGTFLVLISILLFSMIILNKKRIM